MRINAVFSKKVATAQYENETYTVTIEAESEFNNIAEVADYLFHQARSAVGRQIEGKVSEKKPTTVTPPVEAPASEKKTESPKPEPETKKEPDKPVPPAKPEPVGLPATERQISMVKKLIQEQFSDGDSACEWLRDTFGVTETSELSRKTASRIIEALMERARKIA